MKDFLHLLGILAGLARLAVLAGPEDQNHLGDQYLQYSPAILGSLEAPDNLVILVLPDTPAIPAVLEIPGFLVCLDCQLTPVNPEAPEILDTLGFPKYLEIRLAPALQLFLGIQCYPEIQ